MTAKRIRMILALLLTGLAIVFVVQNTVPVDIKFLFWTLSMSGALLFILLIVSGVVMGWFLRSSYVRRTRQDKKKATDAKIEAEIMNRIHTAPSVKDAQSGQ